LLLATEQEDKGLQTGSFLITKQSSDCEEQRNEVAVAEYL
jgi:hypothetical protein